MRGGEKRGGSAICATIVLHTNKGPMMKGSGNAEAVGNGNGHGECVCVCVSVLC